MRALRYYGIGDIRLDDIPEPDCRPGCVKLKPQYVGICGSDMYVISLTPPVMFHYPYAQSSRANPIRRPAIFTMMQP